MEGTKINTCFSIAPHQIRYDTRCNFNVRSKADMSQLNLPHGKVTQEVTERRVHASRKNCGKHA